MDTNDHTFQENGFMELYFGVDEDEDEAALEDAQSLAEIMAEKKAWATEKVPSITKESAKEPGTGASTSQQEPPDVPEVVINNDEDDDNASVASVHTTASTSSSPKLQTLAAKKKATVTKYPNACSLKEATLFYPTSDTTLHTTGVDANLITDRKKIGAYGSYKGYFECAWKECSYVAQTHGVVATHV